MWSQKQQLLWWEWEAPNASSSVGHQSQIWLWRGMAVLTGWERSGLDYLTHHLILLSPNQHEMITDGLIKDIFLTCENDSDCSMLLANKHEEWGDSWARHMNRCICSYFYVTPCPNQTKYDKCNKFTLILQSLVLVNTLIFKCLKGSHL